MSDIQSKSTPQPPPLEVPSDLEAIYINMVRIAHSPTELIFDFAHILPGSSPIKVRSRVVMTPLGAKLFYRALGENLTRYETHYGEIKIPGDKSLADLLFRQTPTNDNPPSQ